MKEPITETITEKWRWHSLLSLFFFSFFNYSVHRKLAIAIYTIYNWPCTASPSRGLKKKLGNVVLDSIIFNAYSMHIHQCIFIRRLNFILINIHSCIFIKSKILTALCIHQRIFSLKVGCVPQSWQFITDTLTFDENADWIFVTISCKRNVYLVDPNLVQSLI